MTGWPDEEIAALTRLWGDGYSASQIANELPGNRTRNAVIGKVHRMRLPGRQQHPQPARGPARVRRPRKPRQRISVPPVLASKPLPEEPLLPPEVKMLSIMDLTEHTCKWPVGDPRDKGSFGFCGASKSVESGPYCRYHAGIAYQSKENREWRQKQSVYGAPV